jgi:hypothetical protein
MGRLEDVDGVGDIGGLDDMILLISRPGRQFIADGHRIEGMFWHLVPRLLA